MKTVQCAVCAFSTCADNICSPLVLFPEPHHNAPFPCSKPVCPGCRIGRQVQEVYVEFARFGPCGIPTHPKWTQPSPVQPNHREGPVQPNKTILGTQGRLLFPAEFKK